MRLSTVFGCEKVIYLGLNFEKIYLGIKMGKLMLNFKVAGCQVWENLFRD